MINIPDNILKWITEHDGVNLKVDINSASADYGYAHVMHVTVIISMLTRTCNHCGYDQIWKPDDSNSKCRRHTFGAWRYDPVFTWRSKSYGGDMLQTLESAFDTWLSKQTHDKGWNPIIKMDFGETGW
jgi:hypothetical protein